MGPCWAWEGGVPVLMNLILPGSRGKPRGLWVVPQVSVDFSSDLIHSVREDLFTLRPLYVPRLDRGFLGLPFRTGVAIKVRSSLERLSDIRVKWRAHLSELRVSR